MTLWEASVGKRLGACFAVLLSLCLFSSLLGMWEVHTLASEAKETFTKSVRTEQVATDIYNLLSLGVQRTTAIAKSNDSTLYDFFAPGVPAATQRGGELARELKSLLTRPEEAAVYEASVPKRDAYYKFRDEIMRLKKAGDAAAVEKELNEQFLPASNAYLAQLRAVVDMQRQRVDEACAAADTAARSSTWLLGGACVSALAIGLVLAWRMTVSITRPLLQARTLAETVAALDLRGMTAPIDSNDEIAKLRQSLQQMRGQLRKAVQGVNTATDGIASASSEIAVGTQDLSQRTEQAASNLQAVAGSMEELTGTVRQTADAARMAQQLAASAQESATSGSAVVSAVSATMQQINSTSDKIADIVGVIDGIAFQTNILALNAAVEAARAGESGRGFAVVASEVRGLAGRSAEAAREIKKLIHASAERVEDGTRLVGAAERAMVAIQGSVQRVTDVIGEISAATGEQSQGLVQVNGAIGHLDQMTQQNAALVEQSTAATESLKSQAGRLAEVVGRFQV